MSEVRSPQVKRAILGAEVAAGFGPGKVILLGEHGVVYGEPALAAPLRVGVQAVARAAERCSVVCPRDLSPVHRRALEEAFARAALLTGAPKVQVSLKSDLPVSMGLGSSAALSVAVARALIAAAPPRPGRKASELEVALAMEKVFHGTPSGVDHATSACGNPVLFKQGKVKPLVAKRPIDVVVVLLGDRPSTKDTVRGLRERQARWPDRYRRLFREIGHVAREGAEAVTSGELESLGDLMNLNQGLLCALQLSSDRIDAMTRELRAMGALGAKLTGAGGDGGAVIGLFEDAAGAVRTLSKNGVNCFASRLAG